MVRLGCSTSESNIAFADDGTPAAFCRSPAVDGVVEAPSGVGSFCLETDPRRLAVVVFVVVVIAAGRRHRRVQKFS